MEILIRLPAYSCVCLVVFLLWKLRYTWANDGGVYVGEFKDGYKNGQGTMTYSNGDKYVGEFLNDVRHGHGTYTKSDGTEYTGEWANNDLLG